MFKIKILRHHWIRDDDRYDEEDLCAHGTIFIQIDDEILSDETSNSWCTTAAVLHLMRSATKNYLPGDFYGQLIPCCGHFMVADPTTGRICIMGCNSGVEFAVTHGNKFIELSTTGGNGWRMSTESYRQKILVLANDVEQFYGPVSNKILPSDTEEAQAFNQFWREWHELKRMIEN